MTAPSRVRASDVRAGTAARDAGVRGPNRPPRSVATPPVDSPAFYIGALGSTRTHAKRVERLREGGMSEDGIARISAPVGLPLGGVGPVEIAVSILAEMTATLRGKRPALA